MSDVLDKARQSVVDTLAIAEHPILRRPMLTLAVLLAEDAERIGDEYDTRVLSGCLTQELDHLERFGGDVTLTAAKLLAVLSDLADGGDENAAEGVNVCAAALPARLVEFGRTCARQRREAANGR